MSTVSRLVVPPPVAPMLAKAQPELPSGGGILYEPKWDGFRCIVFRNGDDVELGSRNERPLTKYFPELLGPIREHLPDKVVLDGEIVIAGPSGLDFDALLQRIHPAESRIKMLAETTPSSFVAFDLLACGDVDARPLPLSERSRLLAEVMAGCAPPLYLTPTTTDHAVASDWFTRFEGAGLDGVVAKRLDTPYRENERVHVKVKHHRTADCVVAGFRWHKSGGVVGSLLLGLYDDKGTLHHVGVTSSFTMTRRKELADELEPLRQNALGNHPWREWAEAGDGSQRMPGGYSRWSAGKDLSWEPVRAVRVCEVKYDHMQGDRFRHAATFLRWRGDKEPKDCTYEQLEVIPAFELSEIFGASPRG